MPYRHLTPIERGQIELLVKENRSPEYIALQIGRSPSSIRREIARNGTRDRYSAHSAQERYERCRQVCRPHPKLSQFRLREYVVEHIRDGEWSPEEVSGRLRLDYPDDPTMRISHETIYRSIYTDSSLRFLLIYLAQSRPKRRKRGQGKTRRGPTIPDRVGIEQRPASVDERVETGHWEADTIVGKGHKSHLVTLVERVSRLTRIIKTQSRDAIELAHNTVDAMLDMPTSWMKTITFDNGKEFTSHNWIAEQLNVKTYFAEPYSAYQRGTNENTNGLIRRYLPKGSCFIHIRQETVTYIEEQLNNRPRKCLGYRTPNEVFCEIRLARLRALRI